MDATSTPPSTPTMSDLSTLDLPDQELVDYIISKTEHTNADFVSASIVAARYDDPNVPQDILELLHH